MRRIATELRWPNVYKDNSMVKYPILSLIYNGNSNGQYSPVLDYFGCL